MARRFFGDTIKVYISYNSDTDAYEGKVTAQERGQKRVVWAFDDLKAPPIGHGAGVAYDSPQAYDRMACAALSFCQHFNPDESAFQSACEDECARVNIWAEV